MIEIRLMNILYNLIILIKQQNVLMLIKYIFVKVGGGRTVRVSCCEYLTKTVPCGVVTNPTPGRRILCWLASFIITTRLAHPS